MSRTPVDIFNESSLIYVTGYVNDYIMNFFDQVGRMAIGSRLRMLSERLAEDAQKVYDLYGLALKPKWFPVVHVLSQGKERTITQIAEEIGHSHPSVSKIIREMREDQWIIERTDPFDKRKNVIALNEKGKTAVAIMDSMCLDVSQAVDEMSASAPYDLWNAIASWEKLLSEASLFDRVKSAHYQREAQYISIVPYQPSYQLAFKQLNEQWISTYFTMEEADYQSLDHPQTYIIDKGGYIFMALYKKEPVGTCALIKMDHPEYDFELAKMAVSPKVQGKRIGFKLGQVVIQQARSIGANKLYLESNKILTPALRLYKKLGFTDVIGQPSPYARCNVQMELSLD